jgi:deoxycytidine triphosphate deaminase
MNTSRGVYSQDDLRRLIAARKIETLPGFCQEHVGPASIDLTTTGEGYRVERLLQPSQLTNETVRSLLATHMKGKKIEVGDTMEVGCTYLVKSSVNINFPPGLYGYLNAKSSSGRNFLFVRALADGIHMFDCVDQRTRGYTGELWLVLQPLAYPIIFTDKECYNQLRIFDEDTRFGQKDLESVLVDTDLLYRRTKEPYKQGELSLFTHDGSVLCTLHAKEGGRVGYKARTVSKPLDLCDRGLDPSEYFDLVTSDRDGVIQIESGRYYLLSTNEVLKVPTGNTAELTALDPRLGFFFTHFAGFIDPGFMGTVTLELFAPHNEFLRHKKPVARFVYENMRSPTVSYAQLGNYANQIETRLPKQFGEWR